MDIRQLEMFVAVADKRGVRAAASALFISEPALSAGIRAMEHDLGLTLFERMPRGMRLTQEGMRMLPYARNILRETKMIWQTAEDYRNLQQGSLSLGTVSTATSYVIPTLLKQYRERYPNIDISIIEERSSALIQAVLNNQVDVALTSQLDMPYKDKILLEEISLLDEEIFVILAPVHPLAARPSLVVGDLAEEPFIVLEAGFGLRSILVEACHNAGFDPKVAMEVQSMQAVKGLVEIGVGVSFAPRPAVTYEERLGSLRVIPLMEPRLWRSLRIITRKHGYLSQSAQKFIELCGSSGS